MKLYVLVHVTKHTLSCFCHISPILSWKNKTKQNKNKQKTKQNKTKQKQTNKQTKTNKNKNKTKKNLQLLSYVYRCSAKANSLKIYINTKVVTGTTPDRPQTLWIVIYFLESYVLMPQGSLHKWYISGTNCTKSRVLKIYQIGTITWSFDNFDISRSKEEMYRW